MGRRAIRQHIQARSYWLRTLFSVLGETETLNKEEFYMEKSKRMIQIKCNYDRRDDVIS